MLIEILSLKIYKFYKNCILINPYLAKQIHSLLSKTKTVKIIPKKFVFFYKLGYYLRFLLKLKFEVKTLFLVIICAWILIQLAVYFKQNLLFLDLKGFFCFPHGIQFKMDLLLNLDYIIYPEFLVYIFRFERRAIVAVPFSGVSTVKHSGLFCVDIRKAQPERRTGSRPDRESP